MLRHEPICRYDVGRHCAREWLPTIRSTNCHRLSRRDLMDEFTADQARRWDAWQHAHAVAARYSDRIARLSFGAALAAALAAVAAAMWR